MLFLLVNLLVINLKRYFFKKKNNKNYFLNSYSNNDSEFENYMKEMKQIKNKKLISLKKKKNSFI